MRSGIFKIIAFYFQILMLTTTLDFAFIRGLNVFGKLISINLYN